jgi:CBS-domain-containing membrane protein
MRVSEVLCRPVVSCTEETSLASAARLMADNDCGILPVLRSARLVGVVTDRDVCVAIGRQKRPASEIPVREIMSTDVVAATTTDEVQTALARMGGRQVRRLPVVDPHGALEGVVSLDDLVLRVEAPTPRGPPPPLTDRDLVNTFRSICARRLLRIPA